MTPTTAPQEQKTRVLYHPNSDKGIFAVVAEFPLLSPEEIAHKVGRNVISVRDRLKDLRNAGYMASVQEPSERISYFEEIKCTSCGSPNLVQRVSGKTRPKPGLHFLIEKGDKQARAYGYHVAAAWTTKSDFLVPHERGITDCHLALDRGFGPRVREWCQLKSNDMKKTVVVHGKTVRFYPDAPFLFDDLPMYLEYTRANPSSEDGKSDLIKKLPNYNALLDYGAAPGKVLFVFETTVLLERFVNQAAHEFPYLWCMATDVESLKHDPTGKIWVTPKDFHTRRYGLIEQAA